ncbi:MAG: type II toxin-antitoxin system VapB family antitoxin [Spartobacteria bacterium]
MRTTLVLDDQLFRRAKREAGNAGTTLSDLVNTALRKHLLAPLRDEECAAPRFSMPVYGEPSGIHQTPRDLAGLRDEGR